MIRENKSKVPNKRLLLLVDFNPEKGGIARVGYLMYQQLAPSVTVSFFGNSKGSEAVVGCKGNFVLYFIQIILHLLFKRVREVYCDHLGKGSAMALIPSFLFSKFVVFLHDEEAWSRTSGRYYLTLKKSTHLVCNSSYTYQRFIKSHPEFEHKTRVCLLAGVPTLFYEAQNVKDSAYQAWFEQSPRYCLFVSRLWQKHRYKGYLELLAAFAQFYNNDSTSGLKLVIVGSGDDEGYVKEQIVRYSLQDKVFLFNDVRDNDLVLFYQNCEALVFPSSREGFGYVFLEAMFFKKACIGLKGQPAEEIIEENSSGILLADKDVSTLTKVLTEIEKNPDKFITMGKRGYEIYREKFTFDHFKKRFTEATTT